MSNLFNVSVGVVFDVEKVIEAIVCADGFTMSVQASDMHYCELSLDGKSYKSVEVGFPSCTEELLLPYAEDGNYTETVYAYVPVELVQSIVLKHGGVTTNALVHVSSAPEVEEAVKSDIVVPSLNKAGTVVCADGFTMSVQASAAHYCNFFLDDESYEAVEVGYPSHVEELLFPYAEDDDYTETVYLYVPMELVQFIILKHGGILS